MVKCCMVVPSELTSSCLTWMSDLGGEVFLKFQLILAVFKLCQLNYAATVAVEETGLKRE